MGNIRLSDPPARQGNAPEPEPPLFAVPANACIAALIAALVCLSYVKRAIPALPYCLAVPGSVLLLRRPISGWAPSRGTAAPVVFWLSLLFMAPCVALLSQAAIDCATTYVYGEGRQNMSFCYGWLVLFALFACGIPGHIMHAVMRAGPSPARVVNLWQAALVAIAGSAALLVIGLSRAIHTGELIHPEDVQQWPFGNGMGWLAGPPLAFLLAGFSLTRERQRRRFLVAQDAWEQGQHDGSGTVELPGGRPPLRVSAGSLPPAGPVVLLLDDERPPTYRDPGGSTLVWLRPGTPAALEEQLRGEQSADAAYTLAAVVLLSTPLLMALFFPKGGPLGN